MSDKPYALDNDLEVFDLHLDLPDKTGVIATL